MTGLEAATLAGVLGGAGEGIGKAVGTLGKAYAGFGKGAQDRLKELQKLEELKALGLSEEEIQTFTRAALDPLRAQQKQRLEQQQALLGATEMGGSGQALAAMRDIQQKEDQAISEANKEVAKMNIAERRAQQAEMRKLEEAQAIKETAPIVALSTLFGETAAMGAKAYLKKAALEEETGDDEEDTATGDENEDFWSVIGEF